MNTIIIVSSRSKTIVLYKYVGFFLSVFLFYMTTFFFIYSGYGIAAQALTAIIRAHDGRGPKTALTSSILEKLDLSSADELIGYLSETYMCYHCIDG